MERFYVAAFWPSRRASLQDCAERLVRYLELCSSILGKRVRWEEIDNIGMPIHPDASMIKSLLKTGVCRNQVDGSIIRSAGFDFSLVWRQSKHKIWWLNGSIGSSSENLDNCVVLLAPSAPEDTANEKTAAKLKSLLRAAVEAWNPEFGFVRSDELNDFYPPDCKGPTLSWMMYLRNPPDASSQYKCEPVGKSGKLLTIQEGVFHSDNPEHRRLLRTASKRLEIPYKGDFSWKG